MATVEQVQREVGDLRRQLEELQLESRRNAGTLASAIRTTRQQVQAAELVASVKRIRPSAATQLWDPRQGRFVEPPFENSLADRLRAGAASGSGTAVLPFATQAYNLLADPTFEGVADTAAPITSEVAVAKGVIQDSYGITSGTIVDAWYASRTAGAGTLNGAAGKKRGMTASLFNSSSLIFQVTGGDASLLLRSESATPETGGAHDLPRFLTPYLTAAIVVMRTFNAAGEGVATTKTATLELWDATDGVVRATSSFNVASLADYEMFRLQVDYAPTAAQKSHDHQLRLRYVVAGYSSGTINLSVGDPMLAWSYTRDAPSYAPMLGKWIPRSVFSFAQYVNTPVVTARGQADTVDALRLTRESLMWGSGALALDTRIFRSDLNEVTVDDADDGTVPVTAKFIGPVFVQGPDSMDLAITYAGPGKPDAVTRTDGALISSTTITYTGDKVDSVVTTRFGKTITVTPTYTGDDITSVHRAVA